MHTENQPFLNRLRLTGTACALLAGLAVASPAQAFPALDLVPGVPDIQSAFITVDYAGNNNGGLLTANGFANVLTPPGSPAGNISGGGFNINANIDFNAQTAAGTLVINGTVAGLGFNSGTLLTGVFASNPGNQTFGAGAGDPLEFLFNVTGGDAAGLYGSQAGVILSQSGYTGSFNSGFSSGAFQALADTFGLPVPEPGTLGLAMFGGGVIAWRRRNKAASK